MYKARFPLGDIFRAKRLFPLSASLITSANAVPTKEKVASREKSLLVENGLKMTHNIVHMNTDPNLIPNNKKRTRGSNDFKYIVPKRFIDTFKFSFFPRTMREWNFFIKRHGEFKRQFEESNDSFKLIEI